MHPRTFLGFYLVAAITFPAVMNAIRNAHQNRFRLHIITLVTLNIALVSYCASVIVLLDNNSEKWDVIAMAVAEIVYRTLCIVAVIKLRSTFEAPQLQNAEAQNQNDLENAPPPAIEGQNPCDHDNLENAPPPATEGQNSCDHDDLENAPPPATEGPNPCDHDDLENAPPPATEGQNSCDHDDLENAPPPATEGPNPCDHDDLENAPPPATEGPNPCDHDDLENAPLPANTDGPNPTLSIEEHFVTQPNYRMEEYQPLTKESFCQRFFNQNPPCNS